MKKCHGFKDYNFDTLVEKINDLVDSNGGRVNHIVYSTTIKEEYIEYSAVIILN